MQPASDLSTRLMNVLRSRGNERVEELGFPPPIFAAMSGEFLAFDENRATLTARFPVLSWYLNPYGIVQGGMVAAAVDNTLGPLSVLIAPPNVTRRLEMTYSHAATPNMEYLVVSAWLVEREGRWLHFRADVRDPGGLRLARAKATHWIIDQG